MLVRDASTATDGRYRIPDLTPGTYRVCAEPTDRELAGECWRNSPAPGAAQDVVVAAGRTTAGIAFGLARRASISGNLTDAAGTPVSAQAYALRLDTATGRWVSVAGASGPAYRIGGLDPGTYRVCFDGPEYLNACWRAATEVAQADDIRVSAGRAITGIDGSLTTGGVIAGTFHDVYTGAQGEVQVDVYRLESGEWRVVDGSSLAPFSTTIPYEVTGLPSGTYRVCAWHSDPEFVPGFAPECHGGTPTVGSADDVVVVQGQTTGGVDFDLDPLSAIRGRVTGADRPVPVQLYTATGRLVSERVTDATGAYAFRDLPNGDYRLAFHRKVATTRWAAELFRNRAEQTGLATSTVVSLVDQTNATGISGVLEPGGSITGRIVDGTGAGVAGCRLRAQSPTGALVARLARSDTSGSFDIGGLSTGPYLVRVDAGSCAAATMTLFYDSTAEDALTTSKAAADPIAVTRGSATALPRALGSTTP